MRRLALALLPLTVACTSQDLGTAFTSYDLAVTEGAEATSQPFLDLIDSSEATLDVALPAIEDQALSDAIIDAWDRGVDVRAITDIDQADDAGTAALVDAGVPLTLADDGITYFDFNVQADVAWTSEQTIMSHAYAIADGERAVVANQAGRLQDGSRVVLELTGEGLIIDLETEHTQVFGGSDAVAVTAFDSAAKSIADFRWAYPTQSDHLLELWLGPQQRLTKRVIDAVYSAKSSVWVLTDDFANDALAAALQDKAEHGFDVEVVVGPDFGSSAFFFSQEVLNSTPDVPKGRICGDVSVPTIVLVDYEIARDDRRYPSKAYLLSHDLYAAARLFRGDEVVNDQLIDGNLWVINDYDEPSGAMTTMRDLWQSHLDIAGGMTCPE